MINRALPIAVVSASLLGACSSGPPPDFAPSPELASRLESIEIAVANGSACPGRGIEARYFGILDDGTRIPFETRYDDDNPPALHVVMLHRTSPHASPQGGGGWHAFEDPLLTAVGGFELNASLRVDPTVRGSATVAPDYSCMRRSFSFSGRNGSRGQGGEPGPKVEVRLDIVESPFVQRLLVAAVSVELAPPTYLLFDADRISAADWLRLVSRGGNGGRGQRGEPGVKGATGASGCPGGIGGPGGAGGVGGRGGNGGSGGRVTVVVPEDQPFLAGLVEAESPGGARGAGGPGGEGGEGGDGGPGRSGQRRCSDGERGPVGPEGEPGGEGRQGRRGRPMEVIELPREEVFGLRVPPALARLLEYSVGAR